MYIYVCWKKSTPLCMWKGAQEGGYKNYQYTKNFLRCNSNILVFPCRGISSSGLEIMPALNAIKNQLIKADQLLMKNLGSLHLYVGVHVQYMSGFFFEISGLPWVPPFALLWFVYMLYVHVHVMTCNFVYTRQIRHWKTKQHNTNLKSAFSKNCLCRSGARDLTQRPNTR